MKTSHSETSASGAHRWLNCVGSVGMCRMFPDSDESEHAKEGTKAHKLAEHILRNTASAKDLSVGLASIPSGIYPDEMIDFVTSYVTFAWEMMETVGAKNVGIEKRLVLDEALGMYGTADLIFLVYRNDGVYGVVIDLKYGRGYVSAEDNEQLPFYAVALAERYALTNLRTLEGVTAIIYQPRAEDENGAARQVTLNRDEIGQWRKRFMLGAEAALEMAKLAPERWVLTAGKHCKWCSAKAKCATYAVHASEPSLGLQLVTGNVPARAILTDDEVANILSVRERAREQLKAVESYAIGRALGGDPIRGWGIEQTNGRRRLKEDTTEVAKGLEELGVNPWGKKLRTIGELERDLKKLGVKRLPDHLVEKSKGSVKLVELVDGRTGLTIDQVAALQFDDIEELEAETVE